MRSAAPVAQNQLSKPDDLMLQNATPLRKSAPWPPNISDEHASSSVPRLPSVLEMLQNPHVLLTFDTVHNPLRLPRKTTSERPKVVGTCGVFNILTSKMCFTPQRRALFDISTSNSGPSMVCLVNVLRATTACTFSSLIWPAGSAPAALASLLFDPPEPQNTGKTRCLATFLPFRASELLSSDSLSSLIFSLLLFSLTLPVSALHLSIVSEVWLLNFLRSTYLGSFQHISVFFNGFQHTSPFFKIFQHLSTFSIYFNILQHFSTFQHISAFVKISQHISAFVNIFHWNSPIRFNTLQHIPAVVKIFQQVPALFNISNIFHDFSTYFNIIQHFSRYFNIFQNCSINMFQHISAFVNILQHILTYFNMLQHASTHFNMLHISTCFSIFHSASRHFKKFQHNSTYIPALLDISRNSNIFQHVSIYFTMLPTYCSIFGHISTNFHIFQHVSKKSLEWTPTRNIHVHTT